MLTKYCLLDYSKEELGSAKKTVIYADSIHVEDFNVDTDTPLLAWTIASKDHLNNVVVTMAFYKPFDIVPHGHKGYKVIKPIPLTPEQQEMVNIANDWDNIFARMNS